jgi:hypothetical protein
MAIQVAAICGRREAKVGKTDKTKIQLQAALQWE